MNAAAGVGTRAFVSTGRGPVVTAHTMVSTGHPLATAAGLRLLLDGGNAFDAAVGAAAVIAVVEPSSNQVGGDVFALCRPAATGIVEAVNASGPAPASADPAGFADGIPTHGLRSATLPGAVAAWDAINERYGHMPLERVLAPAIVYASGGFPVDMALAGAISQSLETLSQFPSTAEVLSPGGRAPRSGDVLPQPDLAATLREIAANGAAGFYQGTFAERLLRASEASGGDWSADDLTKTPVEIVPPLRTLYRGYEVLEQPLPSQGYLVLADLNIAEGFDLAALRFGTAHSLHILAEAHKLAFSDRLAHIGDPQHVDVPIDVLVSKDFAVRRRMMLNPARASHWSGPADPSGSGRDTTAVSVVDEDGNAISLIQSVFQQFGSAFIVPGTGVLLNNRMNGFSLDPESPNCLAGGKRPIHTLNTFMVQRDGGLMMLGGSPGGHFQTQANVQVLTNVIDHGMHWQAAMDAPRWYHDSDTDTLTLESRFELDVASALEQRGHRVAWAPAFTPRARSQGIMLDPASGARFGATDPRWHGQVLGY